MLICTQPPKWCGCWPAIRDHGTTIFVVTHQASLLEDAADEFVWMEFGMIVARTRDLKRLEGIGDKESGVNR